MNILFDALCVGIVTAIIGLLVSYCIMYMIDANSVKNFDHWWSICASFFITGFLIEILGDITGINKWYCTHSHCSVYQS